MTEQQIANIEAARRSELHAALDSYLDHSEDNLLYRIRQAVRLELTDAVIEAATMMVDVIRSKYTTEEIRLAAVNLWLHDARLRRLNVPEVDHLPRMSSRMLARALMTQHHGETGCDPDCEARYHSAFPELSEEEFMATVGQIHGHDWEPPVGNEP